MLPSFDIDIHYILCYNTANTKWGAPPGVSPFLYAKVYYYGGTVMNKSIARKVAFAGILIAVCVICSPLSIPVGASKCFPVQHLVNILAAVILGPFYGVVMAFLTSLIRILIGTGTLLAFPGSMCGALLCGLVYKYSRKLTATCIGEVFGTSVLGGVCAYPIAVLIMGKEAALLSYIFPFFVSTAGGAVIAAVILAGLKRTGILSRL